MKSVEIAEAGSNWLELVARIEAGEKFALTKNGSPVACLTQWRERKAGAMSIGPEIFEPLPEDELRAWEGGD
jgi:antitoxin (DNA-binding transcriptional repressor) of toxin-antitoxin stability system